jgi:RimJ/RimL family protein N-acetyltransferase
MTATAWPLRTMRLVLRPLCSDDIDTFVAYRRDPEVHPWQSWDGDYSVADAEQLVADVAATEPGTPGSWCQVAVLAERGSCLVGDVAFCVDADDPARAMIGYTVAPEHQANGYATEAVAALLSWLADRGVGVVEADTLADNGPSRRVLERLGFAVAGDLDDGAAVLYRRRH